MGHRMNAGYLITDSIHIGTTEFVLGVSIAERSMFVTWACQGSDYYYWGHYHSDLLAAKKDLLERAGAELEYQMTKRNAPANSRRNRGRSVSGNELWAGLFPLGAYPDPQDPLPRFL